MATVWGFIVGLIQLLILLAIVLAVVAFINYNKLRAYAEAVKEAWSNIGVAGRKQVTLVNQLIEVVKGYQESEQLLLMKISEDLSSAAQVAQMQQQTGSVMAAVNGMAQRYPDLKANQQYQRLMDSMQSTEVDLEAARQRYNLAVRQYNTQRSSIPNVFYASAMGFRAAPYLEFDGSEHSMALGQVKSFSSDDGEQLQALVGQAGQALLTASQKTLEVGKGVAQKAVEGGKLAAERVRRELPHEAENSGAASTGSCPHCHAAVALEAAFCSACGQKLGAAEPAAD